MQIWKGFCLEFKFCSENNWVSKIHIHLYWTSPNYANYEFDRIHFHSFLNLFLLIIQPDRLVWCFLQVTGVGVNTEWGLLMASISEDTGEETPLQVFFLALVSGRFLLFLTVHLPLQVLNIGPLEWCSYLHWYCWTHCCCSCIDCATGQVISYWLVVTTFLSMIQ